MVYNHNGILKQGDKIELGLGNRALNYGDSVFETIRYANGRFNFLEDHYFRLMASMRILRMEIPMNFTPEFLEEQFRELLEKNDQIDKPARVKLVVYRQGGGLYTPNSNDVDYLISLKAIDNAQYQLNEKGLVVDLFKDYYQQKGLLSNIKKGASPLYTLASIFRKENYLDECLLLNDNKHLVEAISSNVFLVKGKEVYTPPISSGCLKGIMRKKVLEVLPKMGYSIEEKSISPFFLQKVDGVFLTNIVKGIQWVGKYRKKDYDKTCVEELLKRINTLVALG